MKRLATGGTIDRTQPISFTWDGKSLTGFAGDTLASALLANGVRVVGRSFKYHRPRGLFGAGVEEPNAIVDVTWRDAGDGERHDPNARATLVRLTPGLIARGINAYPNVRHDLYGLIDVAHRFIPAGFYYKTFMRPDWHRYEPRIRAMAGLGTLRRDAETLHFETRYLHCDIFVIGAGAAGLAAARAAASSGLRVVLADDGRAPGGALRWRGGRIDDRPAADWAADTAHGLETMQATTVFAAFDHNAFAAIEQCETSATDWAEERLWQIRTRQVIFATGAIERPLVFADNDRPGVMSADAVLRYLREHAVLAGTRALVATTNDSTGPVVASLREAGAEVTVADSRAGKVVTGTGGRHGVRWADIAPLDNLTERTRVAVDLVAVSGGWSPSVHLFSQSGGKLRWDAEAAAFFPAAPRDGQHVAGALAGAQTLAEIIASGHRAGIAAAAALGRSVTIAPPHVAPENQPKPQRPVWHLPPAMGRQWIDFQNDVTVKDVALAARENYASVEHLKRYTTLGMANDQGKTSNVNGLAALAAFTGRSIPEVGTTTFRPPFTPVPMAAIAGLRHGLLHTPIRRLPAHAAHVGMAAEMREYGGWLRPACYQHPAETVAQAVQREAAAVRAGAGLFDGSSLGKIEVFGPDAAAFLNLMYYNEVANLRPGRIRYCLLLRETGIVFDDGVVARLAPDRYLLSPSSSHTAGVLAMLELWHQTEYPSLQVAFHDVTSAWATFAVSGPRARDLLEKLDGDIDLSAQALPHMALASGTIEGLPTRIARVSFTGERSFEISVHANYGPAIWRHLLELGAEYRITPYGIEALSVLRAEKGFILIGTDTDGMTLPDDLGISGPLRAKKIDFVGKRSLLTPDALRPDRRQFVGVLPEDPAFVPAPGAHAITRGDTGLRSQGWITTAWHSPTLGRSIALAMIEGGRARMGERIEFFHLGQTSFGTIAPACFYDPVGERLHG